MRQAPKPMLPDMGAAGPRRGTRRMNTIVPPFVPWTVQSVEYGGCPCFTYIFRELGFTYLARGFCPAVFSETLEGRQGWM